MYLRLKKRYYHPPEIRKHSTKNEGSKNKFCNIKVKFTQGFAPCFFLLLLLLFLFLLFFKLSHNINIQMYK